MTRYAYSLKGDWALLLTTMKDTKPKPEVVEQPQVAEEPAVTPSPEATEKPRKSKKQKRITHRSRISEVTLENDIRYRGPLSYRHFRIIGWLLLSFTVVSVLMTLTGKLGGRDIAAMLDPWQTAFQFFASWTPALFLIAAFSVVLTAKNGYKRLIVLYSGLSLLVVLAFVLVYYYYVIGLVRILLEDEAGALIEGLAFSKGFKSFNMFIDLLLCSLVVFFINYRPKEKFQGKKIYIFRSLVALPILYEIASIAIKILGSITSMRVPPIIFPFLTTKPPLAFIIFVFLAWWFKRRERHFLKKGKTMEEYKAFLETNVNSWQFAKTLCLTIVVVSLIDLVFLSVSSLALFGSRMDLVPEDELPGLLLASIDTVSSWGLGETAVLLIIAPLILLFDYHKSYKNPKVDLIIPVAGIGLMAIVAIEGGYEIFKIFLQNFINDAKKAASSAANGSAFIDTIKEILPK